MSATICGDDRHRSVNGWTDRILTIRYAHLGAYLSMRASRELHGVNADSADSGGQPQVFSQCDSWMAYFNCKADLCLVVSNSTTEFARLELLSLLTPELYDFGSEENNLLL